MDLLVRDWISTVFFGDAVPVAFNKFVNFLDQNVSVLFRTFDSPDSVILTLQWPTSPLMKGALRSAWATCAPPPSQRGLNHLYSGFWLAVVFNTINKANPRLWTLPSARWLRFDPSHFYVRESYREIFQQLQHYIQTPIDMARRALIFGPPGVGKSAFLNYFIDQLFINYPRLTFRLLTQSEDIICFPNGTIEEYSANSHEQCDFVIADTRQPTMEQAGKLLTLLVSAPYGQWEKEILQVGGLKLYMPVWSFEELQTAALTLDNNSLLTRYRLYGGSARLVLAPSPFE